MRISKFRTVIYRIQLPITAFEMFHSELYRKLEKHQVLRLFTFEFQELFDGTADLNTAYFDYSTQVVTVTSATIMIYLDPNLTSVQKNVVYSSLEKALLVEAGFLTWRFDCVF